MSDENANSPSYGTRVPHGDDTTPVPAPLSEGSDEVEALETVVDDMVPPDEGRARGMRALAAENFSLADAVGGVRGLVESVAPGLVFVVVFVATGTLRWPLIASVAVAVGAVVVRLVQRTPATQAFGGLLGVGIGVVWAWRSGAAENYFAAGLWTNAAYLAAMLLSIVVRWPLVGVVVEALRGGWSAQQVTAREAGPVNASPARWAAWREDRALLRRYDAATWIWVGLFAVRLAVQVPLYFHHEVTWLGTARLVMGIPLWALVLWLTWVLVHRPAAHNDQPAVRDAV